MASRDDQVREVTGELNDAMDDLRATVAALASVLAESDEPPADEAAERLVTPT